jgi:3-oxoadipate CoA-transferase alpha subunit
VRSGEVKACRRAWVVGGAIGAFFCPTAVGTPLAEGKETRAIDGRDYVLEYRSRVTSR